MLCAWLKSLRTWWETSTEFNANKKSDIFLSLPYPFFQKKCIIKALAVAPSCRKRYLVVNNSKLCCACLSAPRKKGSSVCVSLHLGALWDCFNQKRRKCFFSLSHLLWCLYHMHPYCRLLLWQPASALGAEGEGSCPLCYHILGITALDLHLTVSIIYQVLESAGFLHVSYAQSWNTETPD